jgi:hypothetical protein
VIWPMDRRDWNTSSFTLQHPYQHPVHHETVTKIKIVEAT